MTEEKIQDKKIKKVKPKTDEPEHKDGKHHVVVVKKKSDRQSIYAKGAQYLGTGRRKNAIARVFLLPGKGEYTVNAVEVKSYFNNRPVLVNHVHKPIKVANVEGKYDIRALVKGGGKTGQAGAVAHGLARAIIELNPELKKILKIEGLLTRDPRVKERKKYGRKKARKGFAYRKR